MLRVSKWLLTDVTLQNMLGVELAGSSNYNITTNMTTTNSHKHHHRHAQNNQDCKKGLAMTAMLMWFQ